MNTLEKVARAIGGAPRNSEEWPIYLLDAEDALKALMEPAPDLIKAATKLTGIPGDAAVAVWQAMLGAALEGR